MAKNVKNASEINEFILKAALNETPVFDSYKSLCEIRGNPKFDYVDFEWKRFQFYHGHRDLIIEKSSNNSPPVTFSDLPMQVLEKVVEKSDLVDRLALRKVCHDLRILVDTTEVQCNAIIIKFGHTYSRLEIGNLRLNYNSADHECCILTSNRNPAKKVQKWIENRNQRQLMIADASTFLRNPKLKVGRLCLHIYEDEAFSEFLKSLDFQLNVRSIEISARRWESILPILSSLKPTTLEEIRLDADYLTVNQWRGLVETEQWKNARNLHWCKLPDVARMRNLLHFEKVRIDKIDFTDKNLIRIRDILLRSAHLESCYLGIEGVYWNDRYDEENDMDEAFYRVMSEDESYDWITRRFSIANSHEYFQLQCERNEHCVLSARMTENLKADLSEINEFILNAALLKTPVFNSYKSLCKIQDNQKIDYIDFEWKYFQFYHGSRDLTIERNSDNSSPLTFSNLPIDALGQIVAKLDLPDWLLFRKVSHNIRNLVDSSEVYCEGIELNFGQNFLDVRFKDLTVEYERNGDSGCTVSSTRFYMDTKKYEKNQSFQKAMIADASTFLKNPKLKIGQILFHVHEKSTCSEFLEFLKSFNFQLDVRSIDFYTDENNILQILQFVKSNTLKTISIHIPWNIPLHVILAGNSLVDRFDKIAETEQWKKAEKLVCEQLPEGLGMEKLLHFKEIKINRIKLTDGDLIIIREILLNSTRLESCYLEIHRFCEFDLDDAGQFVARIEAEDENERRMNRIMSENAAFDAETGRFAIPNSRNYFQLKIEKDCIGTNTMTIKKVSEN